MTTLLTVLFVIACILICVIVLMQPAKGGLSALGGSSSSVFGSSGGTTALFRMTMVLGAFIMVVALIISYRQIAEVSRSSVEFSDIPSSVPVGIADEANSLATPTATDEGSSSEALGVDGTP